MNAKLAVLSSLFVLMFSLQAVAAVYTVKAGGGGNFTTIQACSNTAISGDTCEVFAGSYSGWTQSRSGSANSPITFTAHTGDAVTITSGVTISGFSYITISYFGFSGSSARVTGNGSSTHNVITHNSFTGGITRAFNIPSGLGSGGSDNVFSYNVINTGSISSTSPAIALYGDRNLIEHNEAYGGGGDFINVGGKNVVIRDNYFHTADGSSSGEHIDFVQVIGAGTSPTLSFSLIEHNVERDCVNDGGNCHFFIIRTGASTPPAADSNILRFNYAQHLDGRGGDFGGDTDNVPNARFYNNTIATEANHDESGDCANWGNNPGEAINGVAKNNICYNVEATSTHKAPFYDYAVSGGAMPNNNGNLNFNTGYAGAWNAPYTSEPTYAALHSKNPLFANYPTDATLQATSPAINAGVALTDVSSADSGSGTSLVVNDARYFQPGWAGTQGDWIRVGTSTTVQIASVNYATNTLTLATAIARSPGTAVYLYKNSAGTVVLLGSLPTVGAAPFSSTKPPSAPTNVRIVP
jgi:hypothetical protein